MKKGGITEVNSFIAVASSPKKLKNDKTSEPTISERNKNLKTSSRSSSITRTPTKQITKPSQIKIKPVNESAKVSQSQKSKPTTRIIPSVTKLTKIATSDGSKLKKHSIDDKRGTSLGKITMQDVYKRRLSRTEPKSESNSRRNSPASTIALEEKINEIEPVHENETEISDKEYQYEDDFEDYESDFESYSESNEEEVSCADNETKKINEEEKKMDSGSYDLFRSQQQKNQLEMIREALHQENTAIQRLNSPLYRNESNEEASSTDFLTDFNTKSLQNFTSAKKRQRNSAISNKIRMRGEKLLQMVTLDVMQYTLYDVTPIPYDVFMRLYARKDTSQAYVQTNEDNMNSEIQTDDIYSCTKWTQHPIEITKNMNDVEIQQAMLGVGEDDVIHEQKLPDFNISKLNEFMRSVGEEMIALLEDETVVSTSTVTPDDTVTNITDSISNINYSSIPFLQSRPIILITFDPHSESRLLTIHGYSQTPNDEDRCSILCIWNIHQPLTPKMILRSYGSVTCCCFVADDSSFLVAGHSDGSLCVWDLRDSTKCGEKITVGNVHIHLRLPSYNTAEILKNMNHNSSVINVDSVKSTERVTQQINNFRTETLISIEEDNFLIIWTLSRSFQKSSDIGLAPWSKVKFFQNQIIDVVKLLPKVSFKTTTLKVLSESKILLGTDTGLVLKCGSYDKKCKIYSMHDSEDHSKVTCLEICPYDENYFAVGYGNGNVRLYNYNYTEPVSNLEQRDVSSVSVQSLQWVWNKHNHILSLDLHSTLCIYRFRSKDYKLLHSSKIEDVDSLIISPFNENKTAPYLVLLSNKGCVKIHKFNSVLSEANDLQ